VLVNLPFGFVEGPLWAADIARIELDGPAQDALMFALQNLLLEGHTEEVSHPLGASSGIRYVRSREFPSLDMPPLYMTFRRERSDLIELRRIFTEEDVRGGFLL
jgi:hypothetical protein